MSSRPFMHESARTSNPSAGYTVIELLVGLLLSSMTLGIVAREFAMVAKTRRDMDIIMETHQGLQAAVAVITQEVRQAGACLPQTGTFLSMEAEDNGTTDILTFRTGRVDPDTLTCVQAVLTEKAKEGDTTIIVDDTSGFEPYDLVYITNSAGDGEAFLLSEVKGPTELGLDRALSGKIPEGGGVYATEVRTYGIDWLDDGEPVMTITIDEEEPHVLVQGAEALDVEYRLTPCPPCDPVNLPEDDAEWHKVREISFTITVRSMKKTRGGDYVRLTDGSTIKPRNFL